MNTYPINPLAVGQANFNPYYTPMQNVIPNYPVVQTQAPHMEVQRVNGKESVYAFAMGPNSSVILVDNLAPKIWFVTTDSSGYKAVTGFKIIPDEEEQPIQAEAKIQSEESNIIEDLKDRINKLEEKVREYEQYGQSNSKPSGSNRPTGTNAQSNDRSGSNGKGSNGNFKPNCNE